MRRDSRVCMSMLGHQKNAMGLLEYLIVHGQARITEGGAADLLQRLARIYMAPDVVFPPEPYRSNPGFITRIAPARFGGVGPWSPAQR